MLGKYSKNPSMCWTKRTPIKDVDYANVHGNIFKLGQDNILRAYEYHEGPPCADIPGLSQFLSLFCDYLKENNLQEVLGLQALSKTLSGLHRFEVDLECYGTVMLEEHEITHGGIFRTTGWMGQELSGSESHAKTIRGTHQVFTSGKALPDIEAVKSLLREENLIR